jgi:ribosome-binding factor A
MNQRHYLQLADQLRECASHFINEWSNRQSLITITDVQLSEQTEKVIFYVTIYPENAEGSALGFLLRKRGECRTYLKTHLPLGRIPHVEFALDEGEKNRKKVDSLLNS